jgi:phytoene synthase
MTPSLADADRDCRRINRRHGVTYYWAAQLLGTDQRRHVHAIYALCRRADDIVDTPGVDDPRRRLATFEAEFERAVAGAPTDDPTLLAVARTVRVHRLDPSLFERFFDAMRADLDTDHYETWDDLLVYMDGSAAVIGEMLLPILAPIDPSAAFEPARQLGLAFQLTNFLRDVGEDLDLGRQYLPRADVRRFGADLERRAVTPEFVDLMRFEIDRCDRLYDAAATGLASLPPRSRRCIAAASRSYRAILREIEHNRYDVFTRRASVPMPRKLFGVAAELVRR